MAQAYGYKEFQEPGEAEKLPAEPVPAKAANQNDTPSGAPGDFACEIAARISSVMRAHPPVITEKVPSSVAITIPEEGEKLKSILKWTGLMNVEEILDKFRQIARESDLEIGIQVNVMTSGFTVVMNKKPGVAYQLRMNDANAAFVRHFHYDLF